MKEVAWSNGEVEFSVTFTTKLKENYEGFLVEGENHLYCLIDRVGFMDYKIISVHTEPHLK